MWMNKGDKQRHVGATKMNQGSSRSHSIFTVYLEIEDKKNDGKIRAGKLNLVDLAGSERQAKTEATGDRLKEATKINLSLSALGNVIAALVSGTSKHIPYRDSKLTRLLEDSLGGNTKTLMIAAISPADDNYEETLSTLKYANRAKQIKNKPKINEDPKDAMLRQFQDELEKLRSQLKNGGGGGGTAARGVAGAAGITEEDRRKMAEMERMQYNLEEENRNIENRLKNNDDLFQTEKQKRESLERKLQELQKAMVSGGDLTGGADFAEFQEMKEQNQKWESQKNKNSKNQKGTDPLHVITDNIDEMSQKYDIVYKNYQQIQRDVRDQENSNVKEKSEILETLRYQERELDFLNQIVAMVLSEEELKQIRERVDFEEGEEDENLEIPDFYFTEKTNLVNLPNLPRGEEPFRLILIIFRQQTGFTPAKRQRTEIRHLQELSSFNQIKCEY